MKTRNELRALVNQLKTSTCMDCLKEGITKVWPPEQRQRKLDGMRRHLEKKVANG